jgi:uroporphyrinogen-III synthase
MPKQTHPLAGRLFLLPRTQDRPSRIAAALRAAGAEVVEAKDDAQAMAALGRRLPDAILVPSSGSVCAITGYLTTLREHEQRPAVAAMGPASAAAAATCGFAPDVVAAEADVGAFVHAVTTLVLGTVPR